ncbi:MAG: hypothetical protein IT179_20885 [Acidobacteria bacterium]|nr:hypothetical protein [Acidobacteriota bacterium]
MNAALIAGRPGEAQARLVFRSVELAARTALRFIEGGLQIPVIVDDRNAVIWDYPGGDPRDEPGRGALERLHLLAGRA